MTSFKNFLLLLLASLPMKVSAIWPEPQTYTHGNQVIWLAPDFQIFLQSTNSNSTVFKSNHRRPRPYVIFESFYDSLHSQNFFSGASEPTSISNGIVASAINRAMSSIRETSFIPWKFYPRNSDFEPTLNQSSTQITRINIFQSPEPTDKNLNEISFLNGDESYSLDVTEDGQVTIQSSSGLGTLRGLETLQQLFFQHSKHPRVYTDLAPVHIVDKPHFKWRGLNLDISRNPISPKDVMRTIDAMSATKLNYLHVHATDGQSWPIEIPALPDLSARGAYQSSLVWTTEDLRTVQEYGLSRGISVYLEIDMPGHTSAIAHAFPDLISAFQNPDWSTYCAEPPCGSLKLNSSSVYDFITTLFQDLLPRLTPYASYFHTGGDEVNQNAYLLDDTVKSNDSAVLQPLIQRLVNHAHSLVRQQGLTPIVWEEMALVWNLTFLSSSNTTTSPPDVLVQTWTSQDTLLQALKKGYRTLFGAYNFWYLDCGLGGFINPTPGDPQTLIHDPFLDYCNPVKNWRHMYSYNPYINISESLWPLMEGGEMHMWSEQTDPTTLDRMIWPRAAAAAEVLWSGPTNTTGNVNMTDVQRRLAMWRERIILSAGVQAGMVGMTYCLMGEGNCEL